MSGIKRARLFVIVVVLTLLAALPGAVTAEAPFVERFSWENAPEFFADCAAWGYGDYQIVGQSSGFGSFKEWRDRDGNVTRAHIYLHIDNVIMNTATGQTWRDVGRHTDFYSDFSDLGPNVQRRAGVTYVIHGPDGGIILHDAGTITFNFTSGEIEHVGGPHDVGELASFAEFVDLFCTTFA
jgi:hypothetical protein